jgi:hypothetical protein
MSIANCSRVTRGGPCLRFAPFEPPPAPARPCGSPEWVRALEAQANRKLAPRPVGRPPKLDGQVESMDLFGG